VCYKILHYCTLQKGLVPGSPSSTANNHFLSEAPAEPAKRNTRGRCVTWCLSFRCVPNYTAWWCNSIWVWCPTTTL